MDGLSSDWVDMSIQRPRSFAKKFDGFPGMKNNSSMRKPGKTGNQEEFYKESRKIIFNDKPHPRRVHP